MKDIQSEKILLIQQILEVTDEGLLNALKKMLEFGLKNQTGSTSADDFWNDLTSEQKEKIELAIRQLEEGKGISHDDVMVEFREKYKA
ncbi:MAG: hypothetical protein KDC85_11815 [Saprospiraceae bacterium]|nr:hypothetical protein [Saprospiraceae bacterium]MCB9326188.1 hypothetical protein [Lewinellaceae bacterium]